MRCTVADVRTVLTELRTGQRFTGTHHETFPPRAEQTEAVEQTYVYFQSRWQEDAHAVPRFLWNAKMRFGKTFTSYQLARKLAAKRVLVVTFKPAVEDAWRTDLETHVDFDGWQYLSRSSGRDPSQIDNDKPVVYFGSFQDLLGRDATGNIKPRNEWLHTIDWDLVVFDEYHFGAWRDTAKELFEGEEAAVAKAESKLEYAGDLDAVNEDLAVLSEAEAEFLPITTRAYLYLSGTPFKALATGEFIEEQIFNWTYTDEQRAKEAFAAAHPGQRNPYGALPQMRLLTYQMPDELLAIASAGEFGEFDLNEFFAASGVSVLATFKHKDDVQKWLSIIRGAYAPQTVEALKTGNAPTLPLFRRTAVALPPARLLVPAQRRGLPGDGEPAGREAERLLARLQGGGGRGGRGRNRPRSAPAGARRHRQRLRYQDDHPVVRQAHDRCDGAAMVVNPDAA